MLNYYTLSCREFNTYFKFNFEIYKNRTGESIRKILDIKRSYAIILFMSGR